MIDLYVNITNSIVALEKALRIAISNADNFNTPGYKYTFASFTTVYNDVLSSGTKTTNPIEFGGSMTLGSTSTDFSQGNISFGTPMDVAIVGEGFLVLSASAIEFDAGSRKLFTRNGRMQTDFSNTFVTDAFGRKVFGFKTNAAGQITDNTLVAIQTNDETDIGFIEGGVLVANFEANKADPSIAQKPMYRLATSTFRNKQGLVSATGGAYKETVASGQPISIKTAGQSLTDSATGSVYGDILGSSLESSNIDVAKVALDMNLLNRGFSAIQGVIDDVNKVLQGLLSKLGA